MPSCDASTLLASAQTNGYARLSLRQIKECVALQAGIHSTSLIPDPPVASAATSITDASFAANWAASTAATGYFLDVSTSNTFATFVSGFNNLSVGNVITYPVTGLALSTIYYFRVRATNAAGTSASSNVVTVTTGSSAPVPSGILVWYRAENNVLDYEGLVNGTDVGGISYGTGEVANCFVFPSGGGKYNSLGTPAALKISTFTIELWRKRAVAGETGSPGYGQLVSWGNGGWNFFEYGTFGGGAKNGHLAVGKSGISVFFEGSTGLPSDTNWHHVACAVDAVGLKAHLWMDGVALTPQSMSAPGFTFTTTLAIPGTGTDTFAGSIDEVSIYNRVLTDAEILAIFTAGPAGKQL